MATVLCDVRDELRRGEEPFSKIMAAVESLAPGDSLELLAIFEPVPLYRVLGRKGFDHRTERTPEGDWRIVFVPADSV